MPALARPCGPAAPPLRVRAAGALLLAAAAAAPTAAAEQSCSSDGQRRPLVLRERFIGADCTSCWTDASGRALPPRTLAIEWIVPSPKGEEAPLSAAASRDALTRLKALGRPVPLQADLVESRLLAAARTLRVAHGPVVNDYVAASIELKPAGTGPWSAWLVLVETVPVGTEGTPVERHVVRNVFQPPWDARRPATRAEQTRLFDSRPMRIPDGADPRRLSVVAWVQDARGRVRAIAQSGCVPPVPSR